MVQGSLRLTVSIPWLSKPTTCLLSNQTRKDQSTLPWRGLLPALGPAVLDVDARYSQPGSQSLLVVSPACAGAKKLGDRVLRQLSGLVMTSFYPREIDR